MDKCNNTINVFFPSQTFPPDSCEWYSTIFGHFIEIFTEEDSAQNRKRKLQEDDGHNILN